MESIDKSVPVAESVRVIVAAWQATNDRCGVDLWQVNRPSHQGLAGEGPVNLEFLAEAALKALEAARIDGSDAGDACGCPCHQVVQPGLVPCPRCEQEGARP